MALPTRDELVASVASVDAKLTLVEGAGGLLVELGAGGVTLRDLARDLAAPVLVVVSPGLGTLNHTALTLEALAAQRYSMCRTGDRRLAARTGCGRGGQSRRAGQVGCGAGGAARGCGSAERGRVRVDERGGVRRAVGHEPGRLMVHSVELVFDPDTEAAVRRIWDGLREAGIPSQAPASRPHATLTVAERIDPEVDALLGARCGAVSRSRAGSARRCCSAGPRWCSRGLWCRRWRCSTCTPRCTGCACRICRPVRWRMPCRGSGPRTSRWPVASCRHSWAAHCGSRASRQEIVGRVAGLRRWDGNAKLEYRDQLTNAATLFGTHIRHASITSSRISSRSIASSRT